LTQQTFDVRAHAVVPQSGTPASLNCTLLGTLCSPDDPESRDDELLPEPELLDFEPLDAPVPLELPLEPLPDPELLPDPLEPPPELPSLEPPSSDSPGEKPPVPLLPHPENEPPTSALAMSATHSPDPAYATERAAIRESSSCPNHKP
jgi:hypothetical protein